jgi:hypothetical protein
MSALADFSPFSISAAGAILASALSAAAAAATAFAVLLLPLVLREDGLDAVFATYTQI